MKRNQSLEVLERTKVGAAETEVTPIVERDAVSVATAETDSETASSENDAFFDSLFPEKPLPEPTSAASPKGAIIQTSRTTYRVLDPWTEPLRSGITDPRSDLAGDSAAWIKVLSLAFREDGNAADGVYATLHGVRCCGAVLERRADRYYIRKGVAEEGDWTAARSALVERETAVKGILEEARR